MSACFQFIATVEGTMKVHSMGRYGREHSCAFSLGTVANSPCFLLKGKAVETKKVLFRKSNIKNLVKKRLQDGKLTIVFCGLMWDSLVVSSVRDKSALRRFVDELERLMSQLSSVKDLTPPPLAGDSPISTASTPRLRGSENDDVGFLSAAKSPPPRKRCSSTGLTPSPATKFQCRRKLPLQLLPHPNNSHSRGAACLAASYEKSAGKKTSGGFYGSSATPPEPFLPSRGRTSYYPPPSSPSSSSTPQGTQGPAAKRNLSLNWIEDNDFTSGRNFSPSSYSRPRSASNSRPPLAALSEKQGQEGFANLGNTCYMNAVLQSLLGMEPFAEDVMNRAIAKKVGAQSLFRMMFFLAKSKKSKDSFEAQKVLLKKIKSAISQEASKFGSFRQQDAHELLGQCLDQLKDDVRDVGKEMAKDCSNSSSENKEEEPAEPLCPVIRNFECEILHTITCKSCGKVTTKAELNYDFALQLPKSIFVRPLEQAGLQQLFDIYFESEEVEYACTECRGQAAVLKHQLSRLPRIMILHLKRYGYNFELSRNSKRVDNIRIPRHISVGDNCVNDISPPRAYNGPWPQDEDCLSPLITKDKENASPSRLQQPHPSTTPTSGTIPISAGLHPPTTPTSSAKTPSGPCPPATPTHSNRACPPTTPTPRQHDSTPQPGTPTSHQPALPTSCRSSTPYSCSGATPLSHISDVDSDVTMIPDSPPSEFELKSECMLGMDSGFGLGISSSTHPSSCRGVACEMEEIPDDLRLLGGHDLMKLGEEQEEGEGFGDEFDRITSDPDVLKLLDDAESRSKATLSHSGSSLSTTSFATSHSGSNNVELVVIPPKSGSGMNTMPHLAASTTSVMTTSYSGSDMGTVSHSGYSSRQPVMATSSCNSRTSPAPPVLSHSGSSMVPPLPMAPDSSSMTEEETMKMAVNESLKSEPNDLQLLHQLGMSEEDQLKLAMELSMQEAASMCETTPLSPPPPQPSSVGVDSSSVSTSSQQPASSSLEAYRLVSVVSHIGRGTSAGHYISDVFSTRDKVWRTYNDSMVMDTREEEVRQRRQTTGYIFFYMHRSILDSIGKH